ncbi:BTB/POZ and MATH domain-containing protein 1 [Brachypodium distachyon]|uniref:BTB domain-containing protein n=1 Tax=Brachypodium distachyon TaxID=15368 RepID=A0A0Q3GUH9_BRADI|nr:BTB/POZ and MATH domain-containing protein 1 [Brachypodium distachyon]KQJ84730.1 hypothetical protein BRADI_5g22478v3 [Brachypodium distachyon]|eukprot:XP_024311851.1 BTB/POZ and MATH domain-containing protein 1 [Brachypodium distachyon]
MGNHAGVQRLPETTTTPSRGITESVTASHEFKVTNYRALDGVLGVGKSVKSATFSVGGYDWEIRFFPDGDRRESASYASIYLACLSPAAKLDVSTKFTLTVLTQRAGKVASMDDTRCTFSPTSVTWGWTKFVEKSKLKSPDHDDAYLITIRCDLTVPKEPSTECKGVLIEVPPSELPGHLERALKDKKGTDVTLLVGGREFTAHRFMLASRSPVLDAQLFGPTLKKEDARRVEFVDMEPAIFQMLLHFIYTDSLPPPTCDDSQVGGYGTAEMQHLLVAADRYGLHRLKLICEEKLCRGIKVENVMSTMALADRHCCHRLKDACVAFMSQPDVMGAVVRDDGFKHLIGRCPMLGLEESHESKYSEPQI